MSEDKVELLSTPYGEVAYESFRELGFAFADKSSVIKELERKNTHAEMLLRHLIQRQI